MHSLQSLDQWLFHLVNSGLSNPYFDLFFPAITDLHKTDVFKFIFLPVVILFALYFQRLRGAMITLGLAISIAVADLVGRFAKHFWERPRPFDSGIEVIQRSGAGGFSFPSNHAVNMFCMAFFLTAFFPRGRWFFLTAAFLVAFSRVYNGVHYPFDVLSGGLLGAFCGILGAEMTKRGLRKIETYFETRRRKQHG